LGYLLAQSPCGGEGPALGQQWPTATSARGEPWRATATTTRSKAPIHFFSDWPDHAIGAHTKLVTVSAALHFTDLSNSSISMNQDNLVQKIQARIRVNIAAISIWTNPNKDMVLPKQDPTT